MIGFESLKPRKTIGIGAGVLAVSSLLGLIATGYETGWGPFGKLFKGFEEEVRDIEKRNDKNARKKEINGVNLRKADAFIFLIFVSLLHYLFQPNSV